MKLLMIIVLALLLGGCLARTTNHDGVLVADGLVKNGVVPCADAIQRLIDENPNREIHFPDGTYLLDKPICTPADPKKSVALRLSAFAKFKAAPEWTNTEAMVRLGAIHPANDIRTPGSWYWLKGGIIDGGGRADGVSIDGGRETLIADVSMKHVRIGLRIKRGANSGSSDCDIRNVNIVGNGAEDSVGVLIEGSDNTLQNMRIADVVRGVVVRGGGNCLRDIHPLFTSNWDFYDQSVGFDIDASDVWGDFCYSDQFATAFRFGEHARGGVYDKCFVFWYASGKGRKHVAFESVGPFVAHVNDPTVSFKSLEGRNSFLKVGKPGGGGFLRNPHCNFNLVNDPESIREPHVHNGVR